MRQQLLGSGVGRRWRRRGSPGRETVEEFGARLRDICDHINRHFDVEGLCEGLPDRVQEVIDSEGDRIQCRLSDNGMHLHK